MFSLRIFGLECSRCDLYQGDDTPAPLPARQPPSRAVGAIPEDCRSRFGLVNDHLITRLDPVNQVAVDILHPDASVRFNNRLDLHPGPMCCHPVVHALTSLFRFAVESPDSTAIQQISVSSSGAIGGNGSSAWNGWRPRRLTTSTIRAAASNGTTSPIASRIWFSILIPHGASIEST